MSYLRCSPLPRLARCLRQAGRCRQDDDRPRAVARPSTAETVSGSHSTSDTERAAAVTRDLASATHGGLEELRDCRERHMAVQPSDQCRTEPMPCSRRTDTPLAVPEDRLEQESRGRVRPRYQLVSRPVGRLVFGDLAIEPLLGPVRVEAVLWRDIGSRRPYAHVAWTDDHGPCHATMRYPADYTFPVRIPAYEDVLLIQQGVDRAAWHRQDISASLARLLAAHLHLGPRSALYRFAITGIASDAIYDELNRVDASRPALHRWIIALARYCLNQQCAAPPKAPAPAVDTGTRTTRT